MFENNVKTEMKRKIYGFNNCPKGQELCLRFLLETEQRKHISTFHWLARSLHLSLVHLWGCIVWKIKGAAQLSWVRFSLNEFTTRILMYFIPANFFGICAHCPKCLTFKLKQKPMLLWALVIFFLLQNFGRVPEREELLASIYNCAVRDLNTHSVVQWNCPDQMFSASENAMSLNDHLIAVTTNVTSMSDHRHQNFKELIGLRCLACMVWVSDIPVLVVGKYSLPFTSPSQSCV